jgi:transmembrane protein 231
MGIPISAPIVHVSYAKTRFRANGLGAWILDIIAMLGVLLLPFLVGFSMGQFWITHNTFAVNPKAIYTGKAMARAVAVDGSEYLWASSQRLETLLSGDDRAMLPHYSHYADDRNRDDKPDIHTFSFQFPLRTDSPIALFQFLPAFHYSFKNDQLQLDMESAPYIVLSSSGVGATNSVTVADGSMMFRQLTPLTASSYTRYDIVYQRSYFDEVRDVADLVNLADFGRRYAARNESTPFEPNAMFSTPDRSRYGPPVYHGANALANAHGIEITLRVPSATVDYEPSFAEAVKFGWVQYFCIAYVFYWAFNIVRRILVTQALVNTIAETRGRRG